MHISKRFRASINLCEENEEYIKVIEGSLYAEVINPANVGKVVLGIDSGNNCLKITIEADTLSHMRALINSILYLVYAIRETIYMVKSFSS